MPSRSVRYRRFRRYPWWRTAVPVVSAYSDKRLRRVGIEGSILHPVRFAPAPNPETP
mgnify:CR=1 FL=1